MPILTVGRLADMDASLLVAIRSLLASPIQRESEVVYFLVEVRKLIEPLDKRFPVLCFFCDWILHREMSWKGAKNVLTIFDQYVTAIRSTNGKSMAEATRQLSPLISFERLQEDLGLLLFEYHLDAQFVREVTRFVPFLSLYVDLVARCPLVVRGAGVNLVSIDNIRVSKVNAAHKAPGGPTGQFAFGINWSLRKGEGEIASVVNEIWIPASPVRIQKTVAQLVSEGGKLKRKPLEAKTFIE